MLELIMLRIGVLLGNVPGYTVTRSPQHLIEEADLPVIIFKLTSLRINKDQDFNVIDWVAEIDISVLIKSRALDIEAQLIAAHQAIHFQLYGDRHLSMEGAYIYTTGISEIDHNDEGSQTISWLMTKWSVEFRTNEQTLLN